MHYFKFALFHLFALLAVAAMLMGGNWIAGTFIGITALIVLFDALGGSDTSQPTYQYPKLLDGLLFAALPLQILLWLSCMLALSHNLQSGWLTATAAWLNMAAFHQPISGGDWWVAVFFVGLMTSTIGTVTAHELVHRTWDKKALVTGRWLLAFSFDSTFAIEHVYGHHRYVGTHKDPATAPRGRNVYQHIWLSTIGGNVSAWYIEAQRLQRQKKPLFSVHNRCLRGYAMSLVLLLLSGLLAGWAGVAFFVATGVWAKALLEIVNYMEHYGLVRREQDRVQPYHSWNTNAKMSSWAMFNLSRHSHHHAQAQRPFYQLKAYPEAPMMPSGYLATIMLTLVPPLWHRIMQPKLQHWDEQFASDAERQLAQQSFADS